MRWTEEELNYLEDNWGTLTVTHIASKLSRSENAIILKAKRLGLGNCYESSGDLSGRAVAKLLNVDSHTVTDFWIAKCGLKGRKKALIKQEMFFIKHEDLIKWLKNNQDKWDSRKVELYALGVEPQWLQEKRVADMELPKKRFKNWTKEEDKILINYTKMGKSQVEIAELMHRSRRGIQRRVSRLKNKGLIPKNIMLPWTEEENEILFKMDAEGKTDIEIAWELGREKYHIIDHRRNLKLKGEYPYQHKREFIINVQLEEIIKLKDMGKTNDEIASKLNIHPCTVYRRLKRVR